MRLRHLVLAVLVIIAAAIPAIGDPDLWIWRDRWNNMGREFQEGYIIGVSDMVDHLGVSGNPWDVLRWAHAGIGTRFPTIKSAVEWANAGVAKGTDPLQMVVDIMIPRLIRAGNGYDEDDPTATPSPPDFRAGFVWKDRWERDWVGISHLAGDGYVAGVFDLIRSLDNAGKSAAVLKSDIKQAAGMSRRLEARKHKKNATIGDIVGAIRLAIPHDMDPTENMALAIFEAMRRY